MNLEKFASLGEEHDIQPKEAKALNAYLANLSAEDIPSPLKARLADYLIAAFNMNSIEAEISPALDLLLRKLQEHA